MRTIVKSKLLVGTDSIKLNERMQKLIDRYNADGLIVKIEAAYSASTHIGGQSTGYANLYDYILVVGYSKEASE
jgi:hypothetical protein